MLPRHKRFIGILVTLIGVTVAISLILASFQDNLLYYVTPSEAIENIEDDQSKFRVGGLVEVGSFKRSEGSLKSRLCVEGNKLLYDFCEKNSIDFLNCGKLIVGHNDEDLDKLKGLKLRGAANGVRGLKILRNFY